MNKLQEHLFSCPLCREAPAGKVDPACDQGLKLQSSRLGRSPTLLTTCKTVLLAIKHLDVASDPSKELVAIYHLLQDAVQREEENS